MPLSETDRTSRKNSQKYLIYIYTLNLINLYKMLHPTFVGHTLFSKFAKYLHLSKLIILEVIKSISTQFKGLKSYRVYSLTTGESS